MHFVQLVDSIVLLYPTPKTIHRLHTYYHQLRKTSSLEEATSILSKEYDTIYYLYSQPTGILVKQPESTIVYPVGTTYFDSTSHIATFTSIEEAIDTYPELFI